MDHNLPTDMLIQIFENYHRLISSLIKAGEGDICGSRKEMPVSIRRLAKLRRIHTQVKDDVSYLKIKTC